MHEWSWKKFEELSLAELYEILKVRQEVFAVEQSCIYQDVDDLDKVSWHLFAKQKSDEDSGKIYAYLRVVFPKYKYDEPSIGRVLTIVEARGKGMGKVLIDKALMYIEKELPNQAIRISAQKYLEGFYSGFGFKSVSEPYDEDGIPHIEMTTSVESAL